MNEIYPRANITCDIIVYDRRNDSVLLIKRGKEPFKNFWGLPGGFFNPIDHNGEKQDESLQAAAARELEEETNLKAALSEMQFLCVQDKPDRDPRGRTITMVYIYTLWNGKPESVKAQDDAVDFQWFKLSSLALGDVPLAFDHQDEILKFTQQQSVVENMAEIIKRKVLTKIGESVQVGGNLQKS